MEPHPSEFYAALVESFIDDYPLKGSSEKRLRNMTARVALAIAVNAIRRGRKLTAREQLDNLKRGLEEYGDGGQHDQ
jgi:hypothetical protein